MTHAYMPGLSRCQPLATRLTAAQQRRRLARIIRRREEHPATQLRQKAA